MKQKQCKHSFFGFIVLVIGIIYLLANINIFPLAWKPLFFNWGMLWIIVGIFSTLKKHFFTAFFFFLLGLIVLSPHLLPLLGSSSSAIAVDKIIWPFIIIYIGAILLIRSLMPHSRQHKYAKYYFKQDKSYIESGKIEYNTIFSGIDEIFLKPVFNGGKINSICGGVRLDLRKTTLPVGETVLELNSICGGITLIVPKAWNIEIHEEAVFGKFVDKRNRYEEEESSSKLIVIAKSVMGGGAVQC